MKDLKRISKPTAVAVGWILILSLVGCGAANSPGGDRSAAAMKSMGNPKVVVTPSPVPYQRKVKVTITGSGFAPNQELELLMPIGGVPSDISAMVKPEPKTDAQGRFKAVWTLDNEIRGKLLEPKRYTLEVANAEGEVLAKVPFVLEKVAAKK